MKKWTYPLLLSVLFMLACSDTKKATEPESDGQTQVSDIQSLWQEAINSQKNLDTLYKYNAVKLFSDGGNVQGGSQIASEYLSRPNKISFINSLYSVEANKDRNIHYDIGTFKDVDDFSYVYLWVWNNSLETPQIELDYFDGQSTTIIDSSGLNASRDKWMALCNTHKVDDLVRNLYTSNTMYFNHRKLAVGHEELIERYAYMNNKDYNLTLSPLHIEPVNNNLAIEIGQCSGTYGGKYILVWQKEDDGNWRILIDSNV